MIDMGTAIIAMGFLNLIGILLILELRDRSWFKKQNFKMQKTNIMNQNKLQLRKMEKELGLSKGKIETAGGGNIGEYIGKAITGYISGEREGGGGIIADFLEENPEIIESFFKGFIEKKETSTGGTNIYNA